VLLCFDASEDAELAAAAGFTAMPIAVEASGPIAETIVAVAEERDAAAIVVGSRGLSGVRSALAGSVSTGVVHHARRPVLVVHRPD
jgi:nucleotide-binding universal stress UspA family protein